jgi:Flp pilus assembly protein TadG
MTSCRKVLHRFMRSRRAVAGIEFSVILPVLLVLLLAFYDAGNAITIYTKTRFATATLAELTNQYSTIHDLDMIQITCATTAVLAPFPSAPSSSSVSQIAISAQGVATVSWSTSLAPGSLFTLPAALIVPNSYLIYSQVSYVFTPTFGFFISGPIVMSDSLFVSPRNSASIDRVSP